jgi:hypothetical protein
MKAANDGAVPRNAVAACQDRVAMLRNAAPYDEAVREGISS